MVLAAALPGTERARRRIEPVLPPPGLEVLPPSPGAEPRAPIVLLPALGFAGRSLLPVARALDGRRLRALVDPPGIEGGPPLPSIDADALLDGLAGAIDRLDAGPVVLAGHSIGGAIAVRLAARRPERVAALVLIDAPVSPFPLSWWERLALHPATWVALLDLLGPVLAVRLALPDVLGEPAPIREQALRAYAERLDSRARRETMLAYHDAFLDRAALGRTHAALATVRAPVLVIWGARDRVLPQSMIDATEATLPRSTARAIERLPDAGHLLPLERPEATARAIDAFLADRSF